jgi:hypothetical protein
VEHHSNTTLYFQGTGTISSTLVITTSASNKYIAQALAQLTSTMFTTSGNVTLTAMQQFNNMSILTIIANYVGHIVINVWALQLSAPHAIVAKIELLMEMFAIAIQSDFTMMDQVLYARVVTTAVKHVLEVLLLNVQIVMLLI